MAHRCAHPACTCLVADAAEFGKFCSEHCQEAGDMTELRCDCKHPGCQTQVSARPATSTTEPLEA